MAKEEIKVDVDRTHFVSFLSARYGMSVEELSEAIGLYRSSLNSSVKNGKLGISRAIEICMYLRCSFEQAFGEGRDCDRVYTFLKYRAFRDRD